MITIYMKNRPWGGEPRYDFIRVVSRSPEVAHGFRIDGAALVSEPISISYLQKFSGWYHPATSWEVEEFQRLGGSAQ